MGKKIVITESQYSRVFLSEQNMGGILKGVWNRHIRMWTHPAYTDYPDVPKEHIYIKNSDGTFSKKYDTQNNKDNGYVSIDDPDIIKQTIKLEREKQFKENITDKKSGDKFRRWVRDDSKRLSKVEEELKKNKLPGTLDASGDYDNDYIKIAWNLLGNFYLINPLTKEEISVRFDNWIKNNPTYDDYSQINYFNAKTIQSDVRKSNEYQNYIKALKNRRSLKSNFGWTDVESISIQNNIEKLLLGQISSSTCINPESLLIDLRFAKESVQSYFKYEGNINVGSDVIFSSTAGGWKKGGISKYYSNFESDKDLEKEYSEYIEKSKRLRFDCPQKIEPKYDNANVASTTYVDNPYKNSNSQYQSTAYRKGKNNSQSEDDPCTKRRGELDSEYPNIIFRWREYQKIKTQEESAKKELESLGFEVNDTTLMDVRQINQIFYILEIINVHNLIIAGQSSQKEEQLCDDIVYGTKITYETKRESDGMGGIYMKVPVEKNLTFSWSIVCKDRGGVFTYPTERKLEKGNSKSIGWIGNQGYCMCARNNEDTIHEKKIYEWAEVSDTRKWYDSDRIGDAVKDCVTDWHCILDIVSIAAYAFGPVGAIVSGFVDAISAIGYVIEGDEGWKLNAGLTALGMFGIGEGLTLAKRGVVFSNKLNDLGTIIGKNVDNTGKITNAFKLERDIANWAEKLSKTEKNLYKEFTKFNNKLDNKGGKEFLNQINKKIKDLPNPNKGTLEKMFKELKPEDMKKLFDESGGDLLKMTNKYSKGVRGAVIQGTLFAGLYLGGEKIGELLVDLYDSTGWDPFGLFDKSGNEIKQTPNVNISDILNKKNSVGIEDRLNSLINDSDAFDNRIKNISDITVEYQRIVNKIKEEHKEHVGISELCDEIYKYPEEKLRGSGLGLEIVDISKDILKVSKEIDKLDNETDIYNKLVDYVNEIYGLKIEKLTNTQKEMQLLLNYPDLSKEKSEEMLKDINDMINDLYDDNNMDESFKGMKLNEEINRIKSLFSDDRLYGNLVNEVCDDVDDAIEFLTDKGYVVKQQSEHDICIGPSTKLGMAYKYLKNNYSNINKFKIRVENYGSTCGLTFTDTTKDGFYIITLFENTDGDLQFNSFYLLKDDKSDVCKQTFTVGGADYNVYLSGKLSDSTLSESYLGGKYIKIGGLWKLGSSNEPILFSSGLEGIFNEKVKTIKTTLKIPGTAIEMPIPGTDASIDGGPKEWMNNSGTCQTVSDFVVSVLGWNLSSNIDLTSYLEKIK